MRAYAVGPIELLLTGDHVRIDELLARAEPGDGTIHVEAYSAFRQALLRHIAMEEKVLLPYVRAKRGGLPLPIAAALRRDHGQIAALLVPSPTLAICKELRAIFVRHNPLEEGSDGLYATCDSFAGDEATQVAERLGAQAQVPMAPHYDGPLIRKRHQGSSE